MFFLQEIMNIPMVSIPQVQLDQLIRDMAQAEGYCRKARPASRYPDEEELFAEPTEFYSGASGYAGATLRCAIQTLETYL